MKKRTFIIVSVLFVVLFILTSCTTGEEPYRGNDGLFGPGDSLSRSTSSEAGQSLEGLELAAGILIGFIQSKSVSFVVLFVLFWIMLYGIFCTALTRALRVEKLTKMHRMIAFSLGGVIMFSVFFVVQNPFARMVQIAGSMNMLFAFFISALVFLSMRYFWNRGEGEPARGNFSSLLAAFIAFMMFSSLANGVTGIGGLAQVMQVIVFILIILTLVGGGLSHIGERAAPGSRLGGPTPDRTWLGDPRTPPEGAPGGGPGGISPFHTQELGEFDREINELEGNVDQTIRDIQSGAASITQLRTLHEGKEQLVDRIHHLYEGRVGSAVRSQRLMQGARRRAWNPFTWGAGRERHWYNPTTWGTARGVPDIVNAQLQLLQEIETHIVALDLERLHSFFGMTHVADYEDDLIPRVQHLLGQTFNGMTLQQMITTLRTLLENENNFLGSQARWTLPNDYIERVQYQNQAAIIATIEHDFGDGLREIFAEFMKLIRIAQFIEDDVMAPLNEGFVQLTPAVNNVNEAINLHDIAQVNFQRAQQEANNPPRVDIDPLELELLNEMDTILDPTRFPRFTADGIVRILGRYVQDIIDELAYLIHAAGGTPTPAPGPGPGPGPAPMPPPGVWPDPAEIDVLLANADSHINPPPGFGTPNYTTGAEICVEIAQRCDAAIATPGIPGAVANEFQTRRHRAVMRFNSAVNEEITRIVGELDNAIAEPWFRALETVWNNAIAAETAAGAQPIIDHALLDGPYVALGVRFP